MKLYQMQVTKTAIYRTAPVRIPRGIVGAALELRFSEEWEGLKKTAVFRAGDVTRDILDAGSTVVIPWECTQEAGAVLEIGLYGTDRENSVAIPTLWAQIGTVCEAADPSGDESAVPSLPVWMQLQKRTDDLQTQIDQLEEQGVRDKSIDKAVADYIADNPIVPEDLGIAPAEVGVLTADGTVVTASGSGALPLHALKLFGKTVQYGTPSPDSPAELVGVGDGGSIQIVVCGKNLLNNSQDTWTSHGITFTKNADGSVSYSGTSDGSAAYYYGTGSMTYENAVFFPAGTYTVSHANTAIRSIVRKVNEDGSWENIAVSDTDVAFTIEEDCRLWITFHTNTYVSGRSCSGIFYPMVRLASVTDSTYEPYKGQTVTAATPNGLPGIPAASGGNYTDASGQQWICDEIDFARGVYVRKVGKTVFDGSSDEAWLEATTASGSKRFIIGVPTVKSGDANTVEHLLTNQLSATAANTIYSYDSEGCAINNTNLIAHSLQIQTLEELREHLVSKPLTVLFELAIPTETDLSAEELAAFAAMRTNDPNTVAYNDAMAPMRLEYYTPISALPVAGGTMGGSLRMAGNRITDLGTPTLDTDAANKAYVDSATRVVNGVEEWINPPMTIGVEYRTTERYNEKAVYAKLVDFGALPNTASKMAAYCGTGSTGAISVKAMLSDGCVLGEGYGKDMRYSNAYGVYMDNTLYNIQITTEADFSGLSAKILVKYTKD